MHKYPQSQQALIGAEARWDGDMKAKRLFLLAFSLAAAAPGLHAQRTNAQITGIITDATGAIIPNADIVVTNEATGIKRNAASNELGYYTVALLPPGKYKVAVQERWFPASHPYRNYARGRSGCAHRFQHGSRQRGGSRGSDRQRLEGGYANRHSERSSR